MKKDLRRAGHVKRDFGVIVMNHMKGYGERLRKVLWTREWTKIQTVTGRAITQQDRPLVMCTIHIRLITVSPLLLSCCPSASSLPFSPTSAQMINPASKGARISRFQILRSSLTFHGRPHKSGVVTHDGRVGRPAKRRHGNGTSGEWRNGIFWWDVLVGGTMTWSQMGGE